MHVRAKLVTCRPLGDWNGWRYNQSQVMFHHLRPVKITTEMSSEVDMLMVIPYYAFQLENAKPTLISLQHAKNRKTGTWLQIKLLSRIGWPVQKPRTLTYSIRALGQA